MNKLELSLEEAQELIKKNDELPKERKIKDHLKNVKLYAWKEPITMIRVNKTGRNDPCPCGSRKKYKYCCINREDSDLFLNRYLLKKNNQLDRKEKE